MLIIGQTETSSMNPALRIINSILAACQSPFSVQQAIKNKLQTSSCRIKKEAIKF